MKYRNTVLVCVISLASVGATASDVDNASANAGPYSAAALYNLGNASAREGKPGLAILDYERARLLSPADPDINANLSAVRDSQHLDAAPTAAIERGLAFLSPSVVALLGLCGVLIFLASAATPSLFKQKRKVRVVLGSFAIAMCAVAFAYGHMQWRTLHAAIVVAGPAPARATPASMAEPIFSLGEGDTVRITARHDEYVLIEDLSGRTGWVDGRSITPIVPATSAGTT